MMYMWCAVLWWGVVLLLARRGACAVRARPQSQRAPPHRQRRRALERVTLCCASPESLPHDPSLTLPCPQTTLYKWFSVASVLVPTSVLSRGRRVEGPRAYDLWTLAAPPPSFGLRSSIGLAFLFSLCCMLVAGFGASGV